MAPQAKTDAAEGGFISEGFGDGLKKHSFFSLSPNRCQPIILRFAVAPLQPLRLVPS